MSQADRAKKLIFARKMRTALETALASNAGIVSVNVDGTSVSYDRQKAMAEYMKWDKLVIRLSRKHGRYSSIRLDLQ